MEYSSYVYVLVANEYARTHYHSREETSGNLVKLPKHSTDWESEAQSSSHAVATTIAYRLQQLHCSYKIL